MSSLSIQTLAMRVENLAILRLALVTCHDVTDITCQHMSTKRGEGRPPARVIPIAVEPPSFAADQRGMSGGSPMPKPVSRNSWGS